jgi:hypothetical protein
MALSAVRLVVAVPAVIALTWTALYAWRTGSADTVVQRTAREIGTWVSSGADPAAQTVGWVQADLQDAARVLPRDPTVEEMLGTLAERQRERPEYLDEALVHFTRAVALRPTSPYAWASVVRVKYLKGDTGPTFEAAVRRATQTGPEEIQVQLTVADYGLAVWDEVAPETRQAVEAMVTGAMKQYPAYILQVAERRGRLAIACRHIADAPRRTDAPWRKSCESRERETIS